MRLARLRVCGFKSFADTTEFTFDDPITGIVGPNGCGKSNVVDAVRWVLGERSSKSLRGKEMVDVIFAGSVGRKPAGMASVALAFENPVLDAPAAAPAAPTTEGASESADEEGPSVLDHGVRGTRSLPIDADIVEVERRLYRDGASEYLINGKRARLRDIRELFMDTGVGADAYSIIEQGKVDAMLLASATERRGILEEAAGVAKYRQRRVEAERKLERAMASLTLAREQLATTDRRLRVVRGQAAKARRFVELDQELSALRAALAFDQYDDLISRVEALTSRQTALEAERARSAQEAREAEDALGVMDAAREAAREAKRRIEEALSAAGHARASAGDRARASERALSEATHQREVESARRADVSHRAATLATAHEEVASRLAGLSEAAAAADRAVDELSRLRGEHNRLVGELSSEASGRRATAQRIERERASLAGSLEAEMRRAEALGEQRERAEERLAAARASVERARAEERAGRESVEEARARVAELEAALRSRAEAHESLAADRRQSGERLAELEQSRLRAEGRRHTLEEMERAGVGLGEAVRDALAKRARGEGFATVIAPLADLIEVDVEDAPIIEAALGPLLRALVVETVTATPPDAELGTLLGRVTFLPLATADAGTAWPTPTEPPDGVRPARPMARVRADVPEARRDLVRGALDRLLGSTLIAPSADAALLLGAGPLRGARFVTPRGVVLEVDGRATGGPIGETGDDLGGVLGRHGELQALREEIAGLDSVMAGLRDRLRAVDADAAALEAARGEMLAEIGREQRRLAVEQTRADQAGREAGRFEREAKGLADEQESLALRLDRAQQERERLADRISSLGRLHEEEDAQARQVESRVEAARRDGEQVADRLASARVEAGRLTEQAQSARRELRSIETSREQLEREAAQSGQREARLADQAHEHARALEGARAQELAAGEAITRLQGEAMEADAALKSRQAECQAAAERAAAGRDVLMRLERDGHALEVARRELEVKREGLEERAREDLRINLASELGEYRELMRSPGVCRLDVPAAHGEVESLRAQIRSLGAVNMAALEEETQLGARNEELARQVTDLDDARAKLEELIATLDQASRDRFGEVFAKIQENFAGPTGMFRKLFGGGKAELRLLPLTREVDGQMVQTDEVDLLESGIEVVAKPPGKEPRAISQLSGGEKTLTAVALLLAIFRSKASPFCVLDEVDAALDDANVGRFCDVLREFSGQSHFVVITHNKKTMQAADRLFGVTMQERGVSTRVSVKFDRDSHTPREVQIPPEAPADHPEAAPPKRGSLRRALASMRAAAETPEASVQ